MPQKDKDGGKSNNQEWFMTTIRIDLINNINKFFDNKTKTKLRQDFWCKLSDEEHDTPTEVGSWSEIFQCQDTDA